MKTTLETIARNTGFSKSTISRVLNNKAYASRISKETVDIILNEAERCGYTPNLIAKNLRINKSQTIGLLVPSLANPYFAEIASVIVLESRKYGYTTIVADTMENENVQNAAITNIRRAELRYRHQAQNKPTIVDLPELRNAISRPCLEAVPLQSFSSQSDIFLWCLGTFNP